MKLRITKFFVLAIVAAGLTGCGWMGRSKVVHSEALRTNFSKSTYLEDKVQIDVQAVKVADAQFAAANQDSFIQKIAGRAEDDIQIPSGTKLFAIVDTTCASQDLSTWSHQVLKASGKKVLLAFQAVPYEPKNDLDGKTLNAEVNRDPCVLGVNQNGVNKLSSREFGAKGITVSKPESVTKLGGQGTIALTLSDPGVTTEGSRHLYGIRAQAAWDTFFGAEGITTQTVKIAIVDTGVDMLHEDLQNRILRSGGQVVGYDFVNDDADPSDDHNHGTMVRV